MFARVTLLEIDAVRTDVDAVIERFRTGLLAEVQAQPGYEGVFMMVNPDGQGMVMTLWSDEESLQATMGLAATAADSFTAIYRAAPGRESYEVKFTDVLDRRVG